MVEAGRRDTRALNLSIDGCGPAHRRVDPRRVAVRATGGEHDERDCRHESDERNTLLKDHLLNNIFFDEYVPFYEGGNMKRDWTYVSDIVSGVASAVEKPLGYEAINLGRGEEILLSDFVARIEALVGRKAKLTVMPKMGADVLETSADIQKARRLIGYDPKVSVQEGIENTWRWYRRAVLQQG